jgi:RHS repeat-associated protein
MKRAALLTLLSLVSLGAACSAPGGSGPRLGEIVAAASAHGEYDYGFDPSGLATSIGTTGAAVTIVRAGSTLSAGADTYRFDPLGRVVAIDALTLAYGADGQIAQASEGGVTVSYLYDEDGQRILKSKGGVPTAAYVAAGYLTATELAEPVHVGRRTVGLLRNGAFSVTATDMRGTVQADTNGTPRLASPFGARPVQPDVAAALDYATKGFDQDLGAVRMGVRDYDPRIAGFLQPDPAFLLQPEQCMASPVECNLYGYARNRPLDFRDPAGTQAEATEGEPTPPQTGPLGPMAVPQSEQITNEELLSFRRPGEVRIEAHMNGDLVGTLRVTVGDQVLLESQSTNRTDKVSKLSEVPSGDRVAGSHMPLRAGTYEVHGTDNGSDGQFPSGAVRIVAPGAGSWASRDQGIRIHADVLSRQSHVNKSVQAAVRAGDRPDWNVGTNGCFRVEQGKIPDLARMVDEYHITRMDVAYDR